VLKKLLDVASVFHDRFKLALQLESMNFPSPFAACFNSTAALLCSDNCVCNLLGGLPIPGAIQTTPGGRGPSKVDADVFYGGGRDSL